MDLLHRSRREPLFAAPGARGSLCVAIVAFLALPVVIGVTPAAAQTNLVQNGNFSQLATNASEQFGTGYATSELTDWSTSGYNFVFLPNTDDTTGATGEYGNLSLWGPASPTPSANGLTTASPTGGNFVGADGSTNYRGAITQTIGGLIPNQTYAVSFAWAGAQQYGTSFTSATTEQWQVSLGTSSQTTQVINIAGEGFSGWMYQTFDFVATGTSEVLSFLAIGTPSGVPPFALLANVSMTQVPEPASMTVLLTGVAGLIGISQRRRVRTPMAL
jgi:hypothetical protein